MQINQIRIGVDIVEINRVGAAIEKWGDRFLKRVYTAAEIGSYRTKTESLAARFAAKEALMKALGGEGVLISWTDIEVLSETSGRPRVDLHGLARARAHELGLNRFEISLSHSRDSAIAFVFCSSDL